MDLMFGMLPWVMPVVFVLIGAGLVSLIAAGVTAFHAPSRDPNDSERAPGSNWLIAGAFIGLAALAQCGLGLIGAETRLHNSLVAEARSVYGVVLSDDNASELLSRVNPVTRERDASSVDVGNETVVLDGRDENVLYLVFDRGEWKLVESSNLVFKELSRA